VKVVKIDFGKHPCGPQAHTRLAPALDARRARRPSFRRVDAARTRFFRTRTAPIAAIKIFASAKPRPAGIA